MLGPGPSEHEQDEQASPITVQGRDGRQYRKRRKTTSACTICGEMHEEPPDHCPWDLFAQGRGPRPGATEERPGANVRIPDPADESDVQLPEAVWPSPASTIVDSVTRAVCIVDELDVLPELVGEIELAVGSHDVIRTVNGLAMSIRELIDHLRLQSEAMARLVRRLERVARTE